MRIGEFSPVDGDPQRAGRLVGIGVSPDIPLGTGTLKPHLSWLHTSAAMARTSTSMSACAGRPSLGGAAGAVKRTTARLGRPRTSTPPRALQHVGAAVLLLALTSAGAQWHTAPASVGGETRLTALKASVVTSMSADDEARNRPQVEQSAADVDHASRADSSFPSLHASIAWATRTPFAQQYSTGRLGCTVWPR